MQLDELIETVDDELGFPITRQELIDRFGDARIDDAATDDAVPLSLREYVEQRRTQEASRKGTTDPSDTEFNRFDSPKQLESYLW